MYERVALLPVVASVLLGAVHAQEAPLSTSVAVSESGSNYVVTVPVSKLTLTIPKGGLAAKPLAGGPRGGNYFSFEDASRILYVSGWFSPAEGFPGIKAFWAAQVENWNARTGLPQPRNVSFERLGSWNAVLYDVEAQGMTSANIRAHWIEAGTWIDVHLSRTSDRAADLRSDLKRLLSTMAVSVKGETPPHRTSLPNTPASAGRCAR